MIIKLDTAGIFRLLVTAGTNIYDLPLEAMLVIDPEGKSQILAFRFFMKLKAK